MKDTLITGTLMLLFCVVSALTLYALTIKPV